MAVLVGNCRAFVSILIFMVFTSVTSKLFSIGRKEVILQEMKTCPDEKSSTVIHTTITKFNRTIQVLAANATLGVDLDDHLRFELEVRRWGQGGWKNNFFRVEKAKACSTLFSLFGDFLRDILVASGRPVACPIAAGDIVLADMPVDLTGIPFLITEGRFMLICKLRDQRKEALNNELFICIQLIMEIKTMS